MSDEPKFFKRNFINNASILLASTGQATVGRIFDRDNELQWQSVGSDDATLETIQIDFKSAGINFLRSVDFLVVLGHNLANFSFEHDIGAGFVATPLTTVVGETENFTILPITKIPGVIKIRLRMTTTQDVDDEKKVGEILALERLYEPPDGEAPARLGFNNKPVAKITSMWDGGTKVNLLRWAGNRAERYSAKIGFDLTSQANYKLLRTVLKQASFVLQPEPDQNPEEFFQVTHARTGHPAGYTGRFKGSGYTHSISVEED